MSTSTGCARILVVSQDDLYPKLVGGMEVHGKDIVEHLQRYYEVSLLTRKGFASGADRFWDVPEWKFRWPGKRDLAWVRKRLHWWSGNASLVIGRGMQIRKMLSRLSPDLIYLNKFHDVHPIILRELLAWSRPVIAWFGDQHSEHLAAGLQSRNHSFLAFPRSRSARGLGETKDRVTLVFNCEFLRQFYTDAFANIPNQAVIYDGVDTVLFRPATTAVTSACFIFLGRTTVEKGFLDFCRVMASLPRECIGSIEIIGEGPDLNEGLEILRASGRSDLLHAVGSCLRDVVADRLRLGSIMVLPSYDEGLPTSLLEAMACGLGVIASDVGGVSEVVRNAETGLLVPRKDLESLMRACHTLAENFELRKRLGQNARHLIVSRYQASKSLAATQRLVASAIGTQ